MEDLETFVGESGRRNFIKGKAKVDASEILGARHQRIKIVAKESAKRWNINDELK